MIIESLFQGKIPIRRVYFNGHVAWTPPKYLPPYLVYLDTKALSDQTFSKIHLEQGYADIIENPIPNRFHGGSTIRIESGNKIVDNAGRMYHQGGPIGLDLFLVNQDITEEYAPTAIQNVMNALHMEQILGEYTAGPDLFVEKYGTPLAAMVGSRIVDEKMCFLGNEVGLSARGAILPHDVLLKVLFESLATGVSATGQIVEYDVLEKFLIDHNAIGLGADGKLGDFGALENFLFEHNATGLSAHGKTGDFGRFIEFFINHQVTGLGANSKTGDFGRFIEFFINHHATGLGANSKAGDYESLINFLIEPTVFALTGTAESGNTTATLTTKTSADRNLANLTVPLVDHEVLYDVKHTAESNMESVSSEPISFTKQSDTYKSELGATKAGLAGLNQDSTIKPTVNTTATMHAMFWLFPVQTGSDLYIPQVYDNGVITGAVQNGSELMM